MYPYAFYSRVLAILIIVLAGLVDLPTSIQYFRLKTRVNDAQGYIQAANRDQMVMNNLLQRLGPYSQKDPAIIPLLQKYGIIGQPGQQQAEQPMPPPPSKPKKK